jgi:Beta-lactamase enzyme family
LFAASLAAAPAQAPAPLAKSADLDAFLARVAAETVAAFAKYGLTADGLSISLIDLSKSSQPLPVGSFRGDTPYYPASVVKAFYLVFYEAEKEAGRLKETPELARAVKDMITVSSNDATGFVVDCITGTTSGPEIANAKEWETWKDRRNTVNRFFETRGYKDFNANQKTFCEDAYGREQAFRDGGKNRNRVSTDMITRLFKEISCGELVGSTGTEEMLKLLSRDVAAEKPFEDLELEDARLAGRRLPLGTKMWAKSGDAYDVHHLVARALLPNGRDFVLAVFTKGVKTVPDVIPSVFERVAARFTAS